MEVNINFGIFWLLGIIFMVLKLTNVIHWSWLWVLSPFLIGIIGFILVLAFAYKFFA